MKDKDHGKSVDTDGRADLNGVARAPFRSYGT